MKFLRRTFRFGESRRSGVGQIRGKNMKNLEARADGIEYTYEKVENKINEWIKLFYKSVYFENLTEEQKNEAAAVISMFADYMYNYFDSPPNEWNIEDLEECCVELMPMKVSADMCFFRSITPVLSALFNFAGENKLIADAAKLEQKVSELNGEIVENALNPKNWGHAKSLVMAAKEAGVDITNANEMNKFMAFTNMQQLLGIKKEYKLPKPVKKTRRNDPCPCASGKKYKKCCIGQ